MTEKNSHVYTPLRDKGEDTIKHHLLIQGENISQQCLELANLAENVCLT